MKQKNAIVGLLAVGAGFAVMSTMARNPSAPPRVGVCSPEALLALLHPASLAQTVSPKTATGQPAPDWQLAGFDGKPIKLSDFKGKVVVLNFWATWCPPCRKEIPTLVALQKDYGAQGVVVVGVSLDQGGSPAVQSFASKMGIECPIAIGSEELAAAYGVQAIPTTFVIDRAGNVIGEHQGDTSRAALRGRHQGFAMIIKDFHSLKAADARIRPECR